MPLRATAEVHHSLWLRTMVVRARVATGLPAEGMATMLQFSPIVAAGYAQSTATLRADGGIAFRSMIGN